MAEHGQVVFGGDGYSAEWHKMAVEERGLMNLPTTADALPYLKDELIKGLFTRTGVLSEVELESRYEVYAEIYVLSIGVEAKLVADIAKTIIYPAAMKYLADLSAASAGAAGIGITLDTATAQTVAGECNAMMAAVSRLAAASDKHDFADAAEHMRYCADEIRVLMDEVRLHADALESEIADDLWPLPKYREMLFIK